MDCNNNCLIKLPLYLHQKILKYCWYDNNSNIKWKLSLSLLSKKHFDYISKLFTCLNYQLLKDSSLSDKLKNPYNCYKYPLSLKCSINNLYSFVRSYYINKLLSISNGNLTSLNLKLDEPIQNQLENGTDEMFDLLIPKLIQDSRELEILKIKSPFNFINNYQKTLWGPLMDQDYLRELSFSLTNFNVEQFALFINDYNQKNQKLNKDGLEKLSIKSYQGGIPALVDHIPLNKLNSIISLQFSNIIINEPSRFMVSISNLNNLKELSIDNLNLLNLQQTQLSINEYQDIFNSVILKYLKNKPHQLHKLNLPFPVDKLIMDEIGSNNQSIKSLSIIPNSMVRFNHSLNELNLKSGYSATIFQQFCELNQNNSTISKITVNNNQQFPNYLVYYFNSFIKNNNNLTNLNINQSFPLLDLESIFKSIGHNSSIHTLSIEISENSPQFNNTNYLFHLLSNENTSIRNVNLKIFYYFQVKLSFIDSKQFNLVYQKDNFKFKYLRNK